MQKWQRYQQTKLANMVFHYALTEYASARADEQGLAGAVKVVAAHPGPTNTGLQAKAGSGSWLDNFINGGATEVRHTLLHQDTTAHDTRQITPSSNAKPHDATVRTQPRGRRDGYRPRKHGLGRREVWRTGQQQHSSPYPVHTSHATGHTAPHKHLTPHHTAGSSTDRRGQAVRGPPCCFQASPAERGMAKMRKPCFGRRVSPVRGLNGHQWGVLARGAPGVLNDVAK